MSVAPATELLPPPAAGRRFTAERTVRLGDVDPASRLRLDAVARYLQDVATDDALDAGLPNALGWVVRRTMIEVTAPATMGERLRLTTFCTGSGRSWAERRTTISGGAGATIDAVSLWVQVDIGSGRPARLGPEFFEIYGEAAAGRTISSRLGLPGAPAAPERAETWRFRRTDLDPFDHVNNAAQWVVVDDLVQRDPNGRRGTGELEYLSPVDADVDLELAIDGDALWLRRDGVALAAARWRPA